MDKRVKQKNIEKDEKAFYNNYGHIWRGNLGIQKKCHPFLWCCEITNMDYLLRNNFFILLNKIISNENPKNEERDLNDKKDTIDSN